MKKLYLCFLASTFAINSAFCSAATNFKVEDFIKDLELLTQKPYTDLIDKLSKKYKSVESGVFSDESSREPVIEFLQKVQTLDSDQKVAIRTFFAAAPRLFHPTFRKFLDLPPLERIPKEMQSDPQNLSMNEIQGEVANILRNLEFGDADDLEARLGSLRQLLRKCKKASPPFTLVKTAYQKTEVKSIRRRLLNLLSEFGFSKEDAAVSRSCKRSFTQ